MTEPPTGQGNQGDDGGDDQRNFWQLLKAHYIDHADDDLLDAVVKTYNVTKQDLTLQSQRHVHVFC